MLKGAAFGAKWMAATIALLAFLTWGGLIAMYVYSWFRYGMIVWYSIDVHSVLIGLGLTIAIILYSTFLAGVFGAIIAGIAAAFQKDAQRESRRDRCVDSEVTTITRK